MMVLLVKINQSIVYKQIFQIQMSSVEQQSLLCGQAFSNYFASVGGLVVVHQSYQTTLGLYGKASLYIRDIAWVNVVTLGAAVKVYMYCNEGHKEEWSSSPDIKAGRGTIPLINLILVCYTLFSGMHWNQFKVNAYTYTFSRGKNITCSVGLL